LGTNVGYWELGKPCDNNLIISFREKSELFWSSSADMWPLDWDAKTQLQLKWVVAFFEQSQTHTHVLWDINFVKITQHKKISMNKC